MHIDFENVIPDAFFNWTTDDVETLLRFFLKIAKQENADFKVSDVFPQTIWDGFPSTVGRGITREDLTNLVQAVARTQDDSFVEALVHARVKKFFQQTRNSDLT